MDPITTAIVAALAAGVTRTISEDPLGNAYETLKATLKRKFGRESDVVKAVDDLEAKPDSVGRTETLKEEIADARADQDPEIITAVQHLQDLLKSSGVAVSASGERAVAAGGDARDIAYDEARVVRTDIGGSVHGSSVTTAGGDVTNSSPPVASVSELHTLFEPVLTQIRARPADPDVDTTEILQTVQRVRDEAALGQAANPSRIERWLNNLAEMAPDVRDAVVTRLQQPVSSISEVVRQTAARAGK